MKILGWDYGTYLSHYIHLAEEGNEVKYYTNWQSGFPHFENFAIGAGFDNIQKVLYFFQHVKWADLITFFEVGTGDIVSHLREKGYTVLGNGREGEDLEQNRWKLKELIKKLGLPIQHCLKVNGTSELRKYLKSNKDKFVKVDIFRGSEGMESFHAESLEDVDQRIDRIEVALGPYKDKYQFIVEDSISDAVEPGFDLWFNGKDFIKPYLYDFEFPKSNFLGRFTDQMPKPLQTVADALVPYLRSIDYRGPLSSEVRITKDGTPYLIDICSRLPSPCSATYNYIKNYTELLYKVATKQDVKIEVDDEYVGSLPLISEQAEEYWTRLNVDPKITKDVSFKWASKVNGSYYSVPDNDMVMVLSASGKSPQEVKNKLQKNLDLVDSDGLNKKVSLDEMLDEWKKVNDFGLTI